MERGGLARELLKVYFIPVTRSFLDTKVSGFMFWCRGDRWSGQTGFRRAKVRLGTENDSKMTHCDSLWALILLGLSSVSLKLLCNFLCDPTDGRVLKLVLVVKTQHKLEHKFGS
jgi:hypothetical protein